MRPVFVVDEIAQHALRQRQVLVQQRGRGRGQALRAQVLPQLPQVLEVVQQLGVGRGLGHGADDEAAFFVGGQHLLQLVAQQLAPAFVLDALRDADVRVLRQVHQHPAGDADLGRQARALGADRVLDHLHQQRLAFGEDFFDRLLRRLSRLAVAVAARALLPDVGDVEEGRALQADLDERRLHAREHARHLAHVDIAHQPAARRALDVQFLRDAALHHGDPRFLRRDVDQDFFVHAGILPDGAGPARVCAPAVGRPGPAYSRMAAIPYRRIRRRLPVAALGRALVAMGLPLCKRGNKRILLRQ